MTETELTPEQVKYHDISEKVLDIIDNPNRDQTPWPVRINNLMRSQEVVSAPALQIVLPWRGERVANWLKSLIDRGSDQKLRVAIRCTAKEAKQALNAIATGVEWIDSEAEQ